SESETEGRVLGRLRSIADAIRTFHRSADVDEALTAGQALNQLLEAEKLPPSFLKDFVQWPQFEFPNLDQVRTDRPKQNPRVSWNRFVQWAIDDTTGTLSNILLTLGVEDIRLFEALPVKDALAITQNKHNPISRPPEDASTTIRDLDIS